MRYHIERNNVTQTDHVVVTYDDDETTQTFWVRDDMSLDIQRDMFVDAIDNVDDVDNIMRDLQRRRNRRCIV